MAPPAIYGDLSAAAVAAYARWLLALFARVEHVDTCVFGCQDTPSVCSEGRSFVASEQQRHREFREVLGDA